jgi:hypothetical protein
MSIQDTALNRRTHEHGDKNKANDDNVDARRRRGGSHVRHLPLSGNDETNKNDYDDKSLKENGHDLQWMCLIDTGSKQRRRPTRSRSTVLPCRVY